MNWHGGVFFAPESLLDAKGRRIIWAWVTDPRAMTTQRATGSGVQSMPRVLSLAPDGTLRISPPEELAALRRDPQRVAEIAIPAGGEVELEGVRGDSLEVALEIDPGGAREVGVKVRCSPDGKEETAIWHAPAGRRLVLDMSRSTTRRDVRYSAGPLDAYGGRREPRSTVEAPLEIPPGEPLRLRIFLDKPLLEVFANDRQCITQQVFPQSREAVLVKACARGGRARIVRGEAWTLAPATFIDEKAGKAR